VRKENSVYFLKGPGGQAVYNSALNGGEGLAVDTANNCMVRVATPLFDRHASFML
jgi:hypothetical protein